jgi:hypothetical protein
MSFLSTGAFEPSDNPIFNFGVNMAAFQGMAVTSDYMASSLTKDLIRLNESKAFSGIASELEKKVAASYGKLVSDFETSSRKPGGFKRLVTGISSYDMILSEQIKDATKGAKPSIAQRALPFSRGAIPGATKGMIAKEIGSKALSGLSVFWNVQLATTLGAAAGFAAGLWDVGGIYEARGLEEIRKKQKSTNMLTMSTGFFDNSGAATMRQRGLAAIHNTQMNIDQVFGREAMYAHQ